MQSPPAAVALSSGASPLAVAGTIEPTRLSWLYRAGLFVVAIAMLLLPLLYLSVVAGAASVVWWHLTANRWLLSDVSQWRLLGYAAPAVIGVALVFFMVKPLLARPANRRDPLPILPDEEPGLFDFIEQICRQVRAPVPRRVQMDCQVNASAGFLPGRLGILKRDLVLTIGLQLVAGLSIRELGGVLAHEFGHFAQGGGMRLTALVRGINGWFARVVYERDHWDEKLENWSKEWDWRVGFILVMARGSIWLSRRVLFGLMMAGHAISCFMMRQMEYDADSYEIKFAGSDAFARTSTRMRELNVGAQFGYNDLRHSWQERALPADLPAFLIERSGRIPDDLLAQLRRVPGTTTGLLDTHPSDADRVRAAEAAAAPGILVGGDDPAARLFRNFQALSAKATRHHYTYDLGLDLDAVALVGLGDAVKKSRRREEGQQAVAEFFGDRLSVYRPLGLPLADTERLEEADLRAALILERDAMAASPGDLANRCRRFESLALRRDKAFCAEELLTAGITIANSEEDFELAEATLAGAASTAAWALEQQQLDAPALERFETAAARRLACGIALAARSSPSGELQSLCDVFKAVAGVISHVHDARRFLLAVTVLARVRDGDAVPGAVTARLQLLSASIDRCLDQVRRGLEDLPCPTELTSTPMTVAAWCGLLPGPEANPPEVMDRAFTLYSELLGQLVTIAGAGEPANAQPATGP